MTKEFFGLGRMPVHIEFVSLLCGVNPADCLLDEPLRCGKVGVSVRVHVLSYQHSRCEKTQSQDTAQEHLTGSHRKYLRRQNTDGNDVWQGECGVVECEFLCLAANG